MWTVEAYRVTAASFLDRHRDTAEQIDTAEQWLDHLLLHHGHGGYGRVHTREIRNILDRVREEGVTGKDCLEAVLATWLLSRRDENLLPSDERLTFQLGLAILNLVPRPYVSTYGTGKQIKRYVHPSTTIRRRLGQALRDTLGVMLMQSVAAMDAEIVALQERAHTLALPFNPINPTT